MSERPKRPRSGAVTEMGADIEMLRTVADYQFGAGAGKALFSDGEELSLTRTSSGRPRQVHASDGRVATYGTDGRLRLGLAGGRRLYEGWSGSENAHRVAVGSESVPYVREGRNAFAKFVLQADSAIRPRDEVLVEHDGTLLAVGRAELAGQGMHDFETGVAVSVREGAD
jgi:uncharacterized protein with predicted RNA binding PUA domain